LAAIPQLQNDQNVSSANRQSRTALAMLSWGSGTFRSVVTMAVGFVATPYLLLYLGAERLGAFRAAQQWTGFLPYLYLGLGPALTVIMLRPASRGDLKQAAAVVKEGLRLEYRQTLLLVAPIAAVMAWWMPTLVPVSPGLRNELRVGVLISLVGVLLNPFEMFRLLLECVQWGYVVNIALTVQALITIGGGVWLAWRGYGIPGQFVALLAGMLVFALLVGVFAVARLRAYRKAKPVAIETGSLWSLRWAMTITGIGGQINLLTDYVVVALAIDPLSVTTFSITQRLVTTVGGFVTSLTNATWAGLAEILASGDRALFEERVLELIRSVLGLGVTILGTLAAYNVHFVRLWVGRQYYGGNLLTVLTAIQMLMIGYFTLFTWTIDLQGDTRYRVPVTSFGAVLNLILSFILGRRYGMYGVTLATLIGYSLTEVWFCPYLFCRRYDVSLRAVATATVTSLSLGLPWLMFVWLVAHGRTLSSWPAFGSEFAVMSLLALVYSWFVILTRSDRARWRGRCVAALRT
jgi:O-antigen/teichoic acid export membrane protein